jgi:ABC-type transport system substrate-binding protein
MGYCWFDKIKTMVFASFVASLLFAIACGAAAPATPAPPAAKAPAAPAAAAATTVPAAKPTPAPAPAAPPRAKVDRLIVSIAPFPHETNLFWEGSLSSNLDERPYNEQLIDVDQATVQLKPMLATKWEMSPDGKTWTFHLRKGIPYHFGFGEFTGADVVHSLERITSEGSLATYAGDWGKLVGKTPAEIQQSVKVVDPYQVVFNLKSPSITLASWQVASYTDLIMVSKSQWDKVGIEGMRQKPAGTGSYQYKERRLGEYIRYERVENHWRQTPEFKELEMRFPPEDVTRLAALLAGETHLADIPRSLHKEALAKGMKLVPSKVPIVYAFYIMGGNYLSTPEKYDATLPLTKKEVREALNRAVNRKELQATIFEGKGEPMYNAGYHPTLPGYNPEWGKQFEAKYGYDPDKAKKLIAQAGYPNGFKVTLISTVLPGLPEMPQLVEAMDIYLRRIGLQVEIKSVEFSALRDLYRKKNVQGLTWPHRGTYRPPEENVNVYNYSKTGGVVFVYEHPLIDQKFEALRKSLDVAERERLLREIGDIKFEEYDVIPLLWLPVDAVIDPKVIGEYNFGTITGVWTHLEYIKPPK